MTPRVATVLSARDWESGLVVQAKETAEVRLVLRAYRPEEVEEEAHRLDVVVAGAETTWVTPARIAAWRRRGLRVVGIFPCGDGPARQRLVAGGADEVLPDDTPAGEVVRTIRLLRPAAALADAPADGAGGRGHRPAGRPGAHRGGPGPRLGVGRPPPHPAARPRPRRPRPGGAPRPAAPPRPGRRRRGGPRDRGPAAAGDRASAGRWAWWWAPPAAATPAVPAAPGRRRGRRRRVPWPNSWSSMPAPGRGDDPLVKGADLAVLVAEASPVGLVRAARLAADWAGPRPWLVLNRVHRAQAAEVVAAARRWTGPGARPRSCPSAPPSPSPPAPPDPRPGRLRRALRRLEPAA